MARNIFKGLGIALVTPFTADGAVDYNALKRLVLFQLDNGADFLCILATTGEIPTLTAEEKQNIKQLVVELVKGRVPILMGCGGNNTAAVIEELKTADWHGIDGILSICPFYNKPSQEGLYQHFKAIANATSMPIVVYNVPGRTGINMKAQTTVRLANDCPNIVGIKEASGNISKVVETAMLVGDTMDIYSGNDDQVVPLLSMGGSGVISVLSNVMPAQTAAMCRRFFDGDIQGAAKLQMEYLPLINALFSEVNPIPVKAAMAAMGWCENYLRLPLTPMEEAHWVKLKALIAEQGLV